MRQPLKSSSESRAHYSKVHANEQRMYSEFARLRYFSGCLICHGYF
jgi:hypothetical protein